MDSLLIGAVAGQRAMTPLAALAFAARRDTLAHDIPGLGLLRSPVGALGAAGLALAELAGDKWEKAPNRIVTSGMIARAVTGGYAGAVLARPGERRAGALIGAAAALGAAFIGFGARMYWLPRFGRVATGLVEDAIVVGAAFALANRPR